MPGADRRARCTVAVLLLSASLCGCNDTRDLAPATPDTPWRTATSGARPDRFDLPREEALPWHDEHPAVDPGRLYTLDELIDIAQRANKQTRVAWETARQAAIGVGIGRAAYLPQLTLSALGGYQRQALPFPSNLNSKGYITSNAEAIFPALTMSYLLLDFGARDAVVAAARQASYAANVGFTGVHQKVIFDVSRAYFGLQAADAQLDAARKSLNNATLVLDAATDRLAHGVGTVVDRDLARSGVAQARFGIAGAISRRNSSRYGLLEAMGLPPNAELRVADPGDRPLPSHLASTVEQMMAQALRNRPDLQADLALLRASQAGVALAQSSLLPKLALVARASGNIGGISTGGLPSESIAQPEAGILLDLQWPIYQGGLRTNQIRLAQSRAAAAEDTLQQDEDGAMRQVATSFDVLSTSIAQYDASIALRGASRTAFASTLDAYRHQVGTLTDADTAQRGLDDADANVARTQAEVFTAAAALAFATGILTSSSEVGGVSSQSRFSDPCDACSR